MTPARSIVLLLLGVGLIIWGLIGVLGGDADPAPSDTTPTTLVDPAQSSVGG